VANTSGWRVNDVVAYEAMRESATTLTALLLRAANSRALAPDDVLVELAELRRDVLAVDGYNRDAVSALTERITGRIRLLSRADQ